MCVPVSLHTSYSMANKKALIDSGASNNFIHPHFAEHMGLRSRMLSQPRKVWNIDGTPNKGGLLTRHIDLDMQTKGIHKEMHFLITDLGGKACYVSVYVYVFGFQFALTCPSISLSWG